MNVKSHSFIPQQLILFLLVNMERWQTREPSHPGHHELNKKIYVRPRPPLWSKWLHARLTRSGPGFDPRSGHVSWVRFFRGFSSPVRQMSGNLNIIWPSSSSFHIRLVGMTECVLGVYCLSCLCCLGGGPGIGLITHPRRPSMSLCGQKSMSVIHSLIPSPDRSWLCKARVAWVT